MHQPKDSTNQMPEQNPDLTGTEKHSTGEPSEEKLDCLPQGATIGDTFSTIQVGACRSPHSSEEASHASRPDNPMGNTIDSGSKPHRASDV